MKRESNGFSTHVLFIILGILAVALVITAQIIIPRLSNSVNNVSKVVVSSQEENNLK